MHTRLYGFLDEFGAVYELQYGFRKKYSTDHAILSIVEKTKQNLDNGIFSCDVFFDLEKVFETVNYNKVLNMLNKLDKSK